MMGLRGGFKSMAGTGDGGSKQKKRFGIIDIVLAVAGLAAGVVLFLRYCT